MASGVELPEIDRGKYYKCHAKTKCNFVICIICENVYHPGEFNKFKNTKYLSDIIVICHEHTNITSKSDTISLDLEDRILISEIKKYESKKTLENFENELSDTDHTSLINNMSQDEDSVRLKVATAENILLKQLNDELKHKNELLTNTIKLMETNKPTYAETIKTTKSVKEIRIPGIKITATNEHIKNQDVTDNVNDILQNQLILPIEKVMNTKKNGTIVKCSNSDDVSKACEALQDLLGKDYRVDIEQQLKPKLKIFGISCDFDKDEMEDDINKRNFYAFEHKCKVLHVFKCANNQQGAIIELTSDIYEHIVRNNHKIYVGYQSYRTVDAINITLCTKCSRYNHSDKKCESVPACIFCAGNHQAKDCKSHLSKCANCHYANENFGRNYNTNHFAGDTNLCQILRKKIAISISKTEYPINPVIPNFIGPKSPHSQIKNNNHTISISDTTNVNQQLPKSTIVTRNMLHQIRDSSSS